MAGRFTVEAVFKAIDKVTAPVTRMQNSIGKFTRATHRNLRSVERVTDKISTNMKQAAFNAAIAGAAGVAAFSDIIGTGMRFEKQMAKAAAKLGVARNTKEWGELEAAVRKAGKTTQFSATISAEAMANLGAAGYNLQQSIGMLPGIIDFATAADTGLTDSVTMSSDVLAMFGLKVENAAELSKNLAHVNDVLARAADKSTVSVQQMYESLTKAGATGHLVGGDIDTLAAMLGLMGSAAVKSERAGTSVANTFLNISAQTSGAKKAIHKLGISFVHESGKLKGELKDVPDILDELKASMKGMPSPKRLGFIEDIFGREGLTGVTAMINAGGDEFRKFRDLMRTSSGYSKKMADNMRNIFEFKWQMMNAAFESIKISIFSKVVDKLGDVVIKITEWLNANDELIASKIANFLIYIIDHFEEIVTWTKRIAIGLGVFIVFTTILKTFILVMTALNIVMALNPIGLFVLGITAAIGLFALFITYLDEIIVGFESWGGIIGLLLTPFKGILYIIRLIRDNWDSITDSIGQVGRMLGMGANIYSAGRDTINAPAAEMVGRPQVVSPQERTARTIEDRRSSAEITIKDETGRAEVSRGNELGWLKMQQTGAF